MPTVEPVAFVCDGAAACLFAGYMAKDVVEVDVEELAPCQRVTRRVCHDNGFPRDQLSKIRPLEKESTNDSTSNILASLNISAHEEWTSINRRLLE